MKILAIGDVHWSTYSSILRSRGEKYSKRLENLIKSVNWAEEQADINNVDAIVYLGDFFDSPTLNSEELTALNEVKFSSKRHIMLIGNHETSSKSLAHTSTHYFLTKPNFTLVDSPMSVDVGDSMLYFLPYIFEDNRKPLNEYVDKSVMKNIIVFGHEDIAGMQLGKFVSTNGFSLDEIDENCDLFINGHLHNCGQIKNVINVGNLTGQNFSEDADKYEHHVMLLDTKTNRFVYIENRAALNFYKIDFTQKSDIDTINSVRLFGNPIVSVKVNANDVGLECIKTRFIPGYGEGNGFPKYSGIVEGRLQLVYNNFSTKTDDISNNFSMKQVDHCKEFIDYMLTIENTDCMKQEIERVCK